MRWLAKTAQHAHPDRCTTFHTSFPPVPREVFDKRTGGLSPECRELRSRLRQLKLSNTAVWDREHAREAAGQGVDTPWFVKV